MIGSWYGSTITLAFTAIFVVAPATKAIAVNACGQYRAHHLGEVVRHHDVLGYLDRVVAELVGGPRDALEVGRGRARLPLGREAGWVPHESGKAGRELHVRQRSGAPLIGQSTPVDRERRDGRCRCPSAVSAGVSPVPADWLRDKRFGAVIE